MFAIYFTEKEKMGGEINALLVDIR